jgi:hypothetical protein
MTVADKIIQFCESLVSPEKLPKDVQVMNPYQDKLARQFAASFYNKYYNDTKERIVLFGINPGRFGGGITGVPFTDPLRLEENCGIANPFDKKQELSSRFIYDIVEAYGGPEAFYSKFYISAISPLGFVRDGKNLNYYDIANFKTLFEKYAVERINEQLEFPLNKAIAFCIGQGQNQKFLTFLNDKYKLFRQIETVPHPRWVMQYRLKRKQEFIDQYISKLIS